MFKIFLSIFLLLANTLSAATTVYPTALFSPIMSLGEGTGDNQVAWNQDDKNSIPNGPFQGPMAFTFCPDGNLLICDSLNSRILKTDLSGKVLQKIDLAEAIRQTRLAGPPALVDILCPQPDRFLLADAANNVVIELQPGSGKARAFASPEPETGNHWRQINRIHTDQTGNIYIEDVSLLKTQIIDRNGNPVKALPGHLGIAIAPNAKAAIIMSDEKTPNQRSVYTSPRPGEEMRLLASFVDTQPILWADFLGFDDQQNLFIVFDTAQTRKFIAFNPEGNVVRELVTSLKNHGYEPTRGHWLNDAGEIFSVRISPPRLEILKLR